MEKHLLDIKNVDVLYGAVQAVWDLSVHVDEGTIVALVGANGAGKSTLLKAIAGLNKPQSGDIVFSGKSILGFTPQDIVGNGISYVPEGRGLFSSLTVLENLELGAYTVSARPHFKITLQKMFDLFPLLKDRVNQISGSLSGGEQQMLAIARGLMSRPKILLLDEPSLGLSPMFVQTVFDLIQTLNDQGVTILLIEQNIHQALKISHFGYVLKTGRLAMSGSGKELLADPEIQKAYMGTLE